MKKENYDALLRKAEQHLVAKQYPKALKEFLELNKSDKPLGVKLGLPDQIEKLYGLIKDQEFALVRGLGLIVVKALNKQNQFQEIYRVPITKMVDDKGKDIHPLRLPAIVRTEFVKAESEEWLEEQVRLFKETQDEDNSNLTDELKKAKSDLDNKIDEVNALNKKLKETEEKL